MMSFKFSVGQAVEYWPAGQKTAVLYTVIRQMPTEENAFDLKYLIKSKAEMYERIVHECELSADVGPEESYDASQPTRRSQGARGK
jgi:hypothetical protein